MVITPPLRGAFGIPRIRLYKPVTPTRVFPAKVYITSAETVKLPAVKTVYHFPPAPIAPMPLTRWQQFCRALGANRRQKDLRPVLVALSAYVYTSRLQSVEYALSPSWLL